MSKQIRVTNKFIAAGDAVAHENSQFHTFPTLTGLSDGSYVCCVLVGSEKTGPDGRIKVYRSTDFCESWVELQSPAKHDETANPFWGYKICYITEIEPKHLLAAYMRVDRSRPEEPLFHPETDGIQFSEVRLSRSYNNGQTWGMPYTLDYKLPDIIVPTKCLLLPDGRLAMPCEVWHEWDKGFREGPSSRLIYSYDKGETWPEAVIMARDETRESIYGDPRITFLDDWRMAALF